MINIILYSIIAVVALFVVLYIIERVAKTKRNKYSQERKELKAPTQQSKLSVDDEYVMSFNSISEKEKIIQDYYSELNDIAELYKERENEKKLNACKNLCYLSINCFDMYVQAVDFDVPSSLPAFERLAIILEKEHKYADALEIAELSAFFKQTTISNRITRLQNAINSGKLDESTGNEQLQYHINDIKKLQGDFETKVLTIHKIIERNKYEYKKTTKFVDDYVVLDIETTGLNYKTDVILEMGCLKYKNNVLIDTFHTLVNPGIHIPEQATTINHITDDMVKDAPFASEKLQELIDFIGNNVIVGHNIGFDIKFLITACSFCLIEYPKFTTINTITLAHKYLQLDSYSLDNIREYFNNTDEAHRALSDCEMTAQLYQYCYNKQNPRVDYKPLTDSASIRQQ
nr:MAG TPA: DNA polymerase III subunit alpha [Caudoviricetes sp.]